MIQCHVVPCLTVPRCSYLRISIIARYKIVVTLSLKLAAQVLSGDMQTNAYINW